jgi:hypothetical protein
MHITALFPRENANYLPNLDLTQHPTAEYADSLSFTKQIPEIYSVKRIKLLVNFLLALRVPCVQIYAK